MRVVTKNATRLCRVDVCFIQTHVKNLFYTLWNKENKHRLWIRTVAKLFFSIRTGHQGY